MAAHGSDVTSFERQVFAKLALYVEHPLPNIRSAAIELVRERLRRQNVCDRAGNRGLRLLDRVFPARPPRSVGTLAMFPSNYRTAYSQSGFPLPPEGESVRMFEPMYCSKFVTSLPPFSFRSGSGFIFIAPTISSRPCGLGRFDVVHPQNELDRDFAAGTEPRRNCLLPRQESGSGRTPVVSEKWS